MKEHSIKPNRFYGNVTANGAITLELSGKAIKRLPRMLSVRMRIELNYENYTNLPNFGTRDPGSMF